MTEPLDSYIEGLLVRARGLSSAVIAWWGAGRWSHWANLIDRRTVIDARYDSPPSHKRLPNGCFEAGVTALSGVQMRPVAYLGRTERMILRLPCTAAQRELWKKLSLSQIGKPYDPRSIIALLDGSNVRRDWRDPSCWFCSEFGIWTSEGAGATRPLSVHYNKIDPGSAGLIYEAGGACVMAHLQPGEQIPA